MNSSKPKLWSVLTYDLKTAVDVCGIPCLLKTPSRAVHDESVLPLATKIKIESELDIYTAHVRVIDYDEPDWIKNSKGCEFYNDRRQYIGCELLLPLSYPGLVRLYQKKKKKTYLNISEVAEDFPRLVRVEEDVACVSPGEIKVQVLRKGTILQLDRLTKSTKIMRGMSETFLMFFEIGTGKEYGFPLRCAVHFDEVFDTFKYTVKEIIDQLPLPRRVEFVTVNPYDIYLVEDEEALELTTILGGPLEIIGIRRLEMFVGLYLNDETEKYEMIAIPKDDSLLDEMLVHIPSTCLVDNDKSFADTQMPARAKQDILREKLYALYVDDLMPVYLRNDNVTQAYDVDDTPAPPLPPRLYDNPSLPTAQSEPQINGADRGFFSRKRYRSLGDVTRNCCKGEETAEETGIRGFFNFLSRRLKRRSSLDNVFQVQETSESSLLNRFSSFKQTLGGIGSIENLSKSPETFVCYLNSVKEESVENDSDDGVPHFVAEIESESNSNASSMAASDASTEARRDNDTHFVYLDDNISINTVGCKMQNVKNEIIYASVKWKSKDCGIVEVKERFCCDICKRNFLMYNTDSDARNA